MAVTVTRRMISTITETAWWTKSNSGTSLPRAATSSGLRTVASSSRTGRICWRPHGDRQIPMSSA
ncbi:Uncharacterised protein [Acinetobacter baumannii]|nr:Uncharacterised protein [Acinetobacter baumannii]